MDKTELKIDPEEYPLMPSEPEVIPEATYWPVILALGTTFFLWGYLVTLFITGLGMGLMIMALAGWIRDLNKEK